MSNVSSLYQISPTTTVDKVSITSLDTAAALPPGYTSIVSLAIGDARYLCAYSQQSGNADLYLLSDTSPFITAVESRIDLSGGPWDSLTHFVLGNDPYLLTYRAKDGMMNFYRVAADLSTSPPYEFYFARNTPTSGFTEVAAITSLGAQYVIGYNFEDGTVAAFSVSVIASSAGGVPPLNALNVWYHRWAKGWTRFAFFQLGGGNYFFKINTAKLNVNIDHLNDNPALGTVEVGSFLQSQMPDALSVTNSAIVPWAHGDPYLATYIAPSGLTAIYRIHGDCLGWTEVATATTVAGAAIVLPFSIGSTSYALFYGA